MIIIGCDYHPSFQQIAFVDTDTGEFQERQLQHRERIASHHWQPRLTLFQGLLLSDGAVPVKPAAFKKAVMHHALAQQKKDDCQEDYKQELSNSERGWLSSGRARRIQ